MRSLDIVIPTYNRVKYLIMNLESLSKIIPIITETKIGIIVSDNASPDSTCVQVKQFIDGHPNINITLYSHKENIGLTRNVIYALSLSKADYVLILGDDDYIMEEYLKEAISIINKDREIYCVLPAFQAISEEGQPLDHGRDLGETSKIYAAGPSNVIHNSYRAHQISGIILKREEIYEATTRAEIDNLYPQIFFTSYSCLHGKCLHLPEYPVMVTQTENKTWKYDDMGLLGDIFQNYARLNMTSSDRFKAEKAIITKQRWRALRYWKKPMKQIKVIYDISFNKNTSSFGKILLPPYLLYIWARYILAQLKGKLSKA